MSINFDSSTPTNPEPSPNGRARGRATDLEDGDGALKSDYLHNGCTRAEALRDGQLLDRIRVSNPI
jgi:hypothetical protein